MLISRCIRVSKDQVVHNFIYQQYLHKVDLKKKEERRKEHLKHFRGINTSFLTKLSTTAGVQGSEEKEGSRPGPTSESSGFYSEYPSPPLTNSTSRDCPHWSGTASPHPADSSDPPSYRWRPGTANRLGNQLQSAEHCGRLPGSRPSTLVESSQAPVIPSREPLRECSWDILLLAISWGKLLFLERPSQAEELSLFILGQGRDASFPRQASLLGWGER